MVIFVIERKLCPSVFKERIAHDLSIQLRYLLSEALKVNLSAMCLCVCVCARWFSVQQKQVISRPEKWYIHQSHGQWKDFKQDTNTHAITMA